MVRSHMNESPICESFRDCGNYVFFFGYPMPSYYVQCAILQILQITKVYIKNMHYWALVYGPPASIYANVSECRFVKILNPCTSMDKFLSD